MTTQRKKPVKKFGKGRSTGVKKVVVKKVTKKRKKKKQEDVEKVEFMEEVAPLKGNKKPRQTEEKPQPPTWEEEKEILKMDVAVFHIGK